MRKEIINEVLYENLCKTTIELFEYLSEIMSRRFTMFFNKFTKLEMLCGKGFEHE